MALQEERALEQDPWADIPDYDTPMDSPKAEAKAPAPDEDEIAPDLCPIGSTLPSIIPQPAKLKKRSWGPTSWGPANMPRNAAIAKV